MSSVRHALPPPTLGRTERGFATGQVVMMGLLFSMAALSLDAGRLWYERRATQNTADMAAMAASRFTGCGSTNAQALAAAQATAEDNGLDPALVTVTMMAITPKGNGGYTSTSVNSSQNANGAMVEVKKTVTASLWNLLQREGATTTITAKATAEGGPPIGTYSVGSVFGISAEGARQVSNLFKGILGSQAPTLDPAEIAALANTKVTLEQLRAAAGAASINDLLNQQMTISQFMQLLGKAAPDLTSDANFLSLQAAAAGNAMVFSVGQILNIQSPPASAVSSASISVFDLLNASLTVGAINTGGVINTSLGLPFIGSTTLQLLAPPIIAIGPAGKNNVTGQWCSRAQSAQLSLRTTLAPFKFSGLDLSIIDIAVRVDLLTTLGHMESLSVAPGSITGNIASQSTTITLVITNSNDVNKDISNSANFGIAYIGPKLLNTGFKAYIPLGEAAFKSTSFNYRSTGDLPAVSTLGAGSVGASLGGLLGTDTYIEARALGLPVKITALGDILGLITQPLGNALDGLLEAYGIRTGSVRLQVMDVQTSSPELR